VKLRLSDLTDETFTYLQVMIVMIKVCWLSERHDSRTCYPIRKQVSWYFERGFAA
jgi:hypothetical protein